MSKSEDFEGEAPDSGWTAALDGSNIPCASEVTGVGSLGRDLDFVCHCAQRAVSMYDEDGASRDDVVTAALWTAAVIAYCRCFSDGIRARLTVADVENLQIEGAADFHQYLRDMRDKHVAHSVNPFERVAVGVVLSPDKERVDGVAPLTMRHMATTKEGFVQLGWLADALLRVVKKRFDDLTVQAMSEATAMGAKSFVNRPPMRLGVPGPGEAGGARARL